MTPKVLPVFPDADTSWMAGAACKGLGDVFFPPKGGYPGAEAKAICRECPVLRACGAYAEATRAEGFRAGRFRRGRS